METAMVAVLFTAFESVVTELTITVFVANVYGVVAVVVTVITALAFAAIEVNVHVRTAPERLQLPPLPPEIEEET